MKDNITFVPKFKGLALHLHIESLIFSAEQAISLKEIKQVIESTFQKAFDKKELIEAIEQVKNKYQQDEFAIEVVEISGGYQFLTKGAYFQTISQFLRLNSRKKLSRVALETLSIIAYKQPVTKTDLEGIRGVNCDYAIQKLLEKELVEILGRSDSPGRPLLYGTSQKFMNYFGLKDLKELPQIKDFKEPDNQIGEPAPLEEKNEDNDGPGQHTDGEATDQ